MRLRILLFTLFTVIIASTFVISQYNFSSEQNDRFVLLDPPKGVALLPKEEGKKQDKESIKYWEWFSQHARANQETGDIDMKDVLKARKQHAALRARVRNKRSNMGLDFNFMGPSNKGGRTRDILFDKDDPARVYTGGVSGGLYISNDGGNSWEPYLKNDTLAGIGVVSLAQTTNGDIYVGTGEFITSNRASGRGRAGSFIGEGIWKSTDGGNSFFRLESTAPQPGNTENAQFAFVSELAAHPTDPNTILAGTASGLQISKDGGTTWSGATTSPKMNNTNDIQDIAVASDGMVHVTASEHNAISGQYWQGKIDDPSSFSRISISSTRFRDLKIGLSPSDENYLYAVGCNSYGATNGLYRSTDGGASWRNIGPGSLPSESFNPTGQQGYYDMEIAVHPGNKDIAYVAGQLSLYEYNFSMDNGEPQDFWWPISNWWTGSSANDPHYVHADHHRMVFHPNDDDVMYVATDGGIFKTKNANSKYPNPPEFVTLNKGYGVGQFNNISVNLNGEIIGGTQDNGVLMLDFNQNENTQAFRAPRFGDGGYCEASKIKNSAYYGSSYYGILRRSIDGGESFNSFYDETIDNNQDGLPDASAPFVPVNYLHEFTDSIIAPDSMNERYGTGLLFTAPYDGIWVAYDALDFGSIPKWFHIASASNGLHNNPIGFTAMEMSKNGNHLFVGTMFGYVYRISGLKDVEWEKYANENIGFNPDSAGLTVTPIASFNNRYVTDIAVDKDNQEHVVVSLGNYGYNNFVYRSTNAVSATSPGSFQSIQNNLPEMPVYSILIDYYDDSNILAGTELGVYASSQRGVNWQPEFNGLPTTPVLTLKQEQIHELEGDCYGLYVGTYGKGIYASNSLSPAGCTVPTGSGAPTGLDEDKVANVSNSELKVFPNPARDQVNLRFSLEQAKTTIALIYNLDGKVVKESHLGTLSAGDQQMTMNISGLANGTYVMVVRSGGNQAVSKLMVSQ